MKTLSKAITTLENRNGAWVCVALAILALAFSFVSTTMPAAAQTAGEAAITGTVHDTTGAAIPGATVTAAPPQLDTANGVLGATIEDEEFMKMPIIASGNQQRDITQFSNYLPGSQAGSRSSLFSGTASRVEEVYLDGIPLTTISQIGDNRPIFNLVPSEAIGEVGALTSGQSVEYQGAGSVNYNMKSGGNQYHGTVADFIRNRIFDTWGFSAPWATQKALVNGVVTTVPVGKPVDHLNEIALGVGGPVVAAR